MMRTSIVLTGLIAAGLVLSACGSTTPDEAVEGADPAIVEEIAGVENLHRITLTEQAATRLGIETAEVIAAPGAAGRTRIPYSSIIYDADGAAWAYEVDGAPLAFVRRAITVDDIVADADGDYAVLTAGPTLGSSVVSVGVAELFGAEFEVGH
jgi:hypothetical protein